ncbi:MULTISPECIES: glycosyltransferase [Actinosynnema]|uniref:Glycosyl transferase group 1 n=1 Tax=Actinosynnema mirum (strain ATCC 29888 / DSM 43827 / JCM 3225 / NBRC 14064 / NCIMB 13271 / NRRL B-12336 / IMRU 3971 / 101) TaxID=446462 RepID=C6WQ80_ACTMD|nr:MULTISPECIES: glycosyltransferase [Actinosynnema]ACU36734.1 glycosyl transferase group 1 [Actinosynnema mirum DSM 43827]MCP2092146.1 Glycosyltransferase involved in cell wall bisynthesis [Actinosynnema pretiosum]
MKIAMVALHTGPPAELDEAASRRVAHVAELSSSLTALGHEITVYTGGRSIGAAVSTRTPEGYQVVHLPSGARGGKAGRLKGAGDFLHGRWRAAPPDLVHAHQWPSGLVALHAAVPLDLPVVQNFHSQSSDHLSDHVAAQRVIGHEATRIVATSASEVARLIKAGVRRTKITVVPYGVDLSRFGPRGPREGRDLPHRILAVGVGRPADGVGDLVVALRGVPNTELVVVGDPAVSAASSSWAQRLVNHARVHGVVNRVRLVGCVPRAAMASLLRSADVVVCAARSEPSGIVALEAMACGVAVVATSVGVLPEVVLDRVTGVLVPPRSPAALARALRELLGNKVRLNSYGVAGYDRVLARYSTELLADEVTRLYQRAVAASSGRDVGARA